MYETQSRAPDATGGLTPTQFIFTRIWAELWDSGSQFYLPNVFKNGFTGFGQNIPPLDPTTIPDLTGTDLGGPLPGNPCNQDSVQGDGTLDLTGMTLTGLSTISANGSLQFPKGDSEVVIPIQFSSLEATGSWSANQTCVILNPCAVTSMARLLGAPQDDVDVWSTVEQDLETKGAGKGQQYIRCYNKWSPTISAILNDKSNGVQNTIRKYNGLQLWNQAVAAVNGSGSLPSGQTAQNDIVQIIGAIMDAVPAGQQADFQADYQKLLPDLVHVVSAGETYQQFIASLAGSVDDSTCCGQDPGAGDGDHTYTAGYSGTFDDTLTGVTAAITVDLLVDNDGSLAVKVTDISLQISGMQVQLDESPIINWLLNLIANSSTVKNDIIVGLQTNIDTPALQDGLTRLINITIQSVVDALVG